MNEELDRFYELLGVAPGTSGRELKEAYRDLAKVWHPDRFSHDPRLQQKAQEKLKEINEAYERLTSGNAGSRTRPHPTPDPPPTPGAGNAVRRRTRLVLPTAAVFCAAFLAALISFVPPRVRTAPEQTTPAEEAEATTSDEGQPESGARAAAGQPARAKERGGRRPDSGATHGVVSDSVPGVQQLRPMPTVTVTVDALSGLLATRDCPTVSTMTYPAGGEPRQYCTTRHRTKVSPQPETAGPNGSRLKSVGKRLAAPLKWLGGGKGAEGGEKREARPLGVEGSQNR